MQVAADRPSELARTPLAIRRVDAIPLALPLTKPVKMAAETVTHARNLLVRIEAQDGTVGWGEAASAPTMTGDTIAGLVSAVRDHLAPVLIGADAWMRPALLKRMRTVLYGNTGAHSAVEMALLDLAARSAGVSVIDLIGGAVRPGGRADVARRQCDAGAGCRRGRGAQGRRHPLLQAQGRRQAARVRSRRGTRRAGSARTGDAALRRRQLRVLP